jgi:hypothetical protein
MSAIEFSQPRSAVLDDAPIGDIKGAFGTIRHGDVAPRTGWWARGKTLLAILGPGLICRGMAGGAGIAAHLSSNLHKKEHGALSCGGRARRSLRESGRSRFDARDVGQAEKDANHIHD